MCQGGGEAEGRGSEEGNKGFKTTNKGSKAHGVSVEGSSKGWADARELAF